VSEGEPFGLHLWFDPREEIVRLYELEHPKDSGVDGYSEVDDFESPEGETEQKPQVFQEDLPF
jgi:hypothetical protein